jgi:8-oxo-dGTP pyrophosphatase MutT (NUDIX family)
MLDIVDENDQLLGTYSRDEVYANGLKYVRVIEVFIKNSDGKLWVPIRRSDKKIAPNGYDVGVGGHIEHGESELEAFRKEVSEEVGWDIDSLEWVALGKLGPKDGLNTISYIFEIKTDETPKLSADDFTSYEWLYPVELSDSIMAGHSAKSNILPLLKLVYGIS